MKLSQRPAWALLWRSFNRLDGKQEFVVVEGVFPFALFRTRAEALHFRDLKFGYIKDRPDLKAEPHGWRMPKVVRVDVIIRAKQ